MIYKLNSKPQASEVAASLPEGCSIAQESSNNRIDLNLADIKKEVANYISVMKKFKVPPKMIFKDIPVNINHLREFMKTNGKDLAAMRIYFAKKTADKNKDDFELLFVPCKEAQSQRGKGIIFKDKLGDGNSGVPKGTVPDAAGDAHVIAIECRKPPGCEEGSMILPA